MVMVNKLKQLLRPPTFDDENKNYVAKVLNVIILTLIGGSVVSAINIISSDLTAFYRLMVVFVIFLGAFWLLRLKYLSFLSFLLPSVLFGFITYLSYTGEGAQDRVLIAYTLVLALATLLLGKRAPFIFTLLSIVAIAGLAYAEVKGLIVTPFNGLINYSALVSFAIILMILAVLLQLMISNLTSALKRAQDNERSLIETNQQLRAIQATLEERVEARARGVELVATVLERLNLLNFDQFLLELVNQVKNHFNYYQVQIYLIDESQQNLVIAAGAGDVGEQMKLQNHTIPLDTPAYLVAQAARNGTVINIDDVQEVSDWLPNPLLPETRSEIAVPIILDEQVAGVLVVEEDQVAGFDQGAVNVLQSLANQVTVALRNARLFEQVETALAEARAVQAQYLQQSWSTDRTKAQVYHYHRPGAPILDQTTRAQLEDRVGKIDRPTVLSSEEGEETVQNTLALAAPITLQNQIIGTLQFFEADPSRRGQWSEREIALVQAVAEQIAQTAENLRLFEETRSRANRERIIREITEKMRAANSLEGLVKIASQELGQRLLAGHTVVELGIEKEITSPSNSSPTGNTMQTERKL
jgi:GAF domain-containing protein